MKYKKKYLAVRQVINEIDPIGLIDLCGLEEYDMEVADILAKLKDCSTEDEIKNMVIGVFTRYFDDPGDINLYSEVGFKLMNIKLLGT